MINWKVMQVLKWSSTVSLCFFYQCWHIPTQAPPLSVSDTPPGVKSQRVTERRCYLNNDWWHHTSHVGPPSSPRCLHPLYLQNLDKPTQTEKLENDGTLSYTTWLFRPNPTTAVWIFPFTLFLIETARPSKPQAVHEEALIEETRIFNKVFEFPFNWSIPHSTNM